MLHLIWLTIRAVAFSAGAVSALYLVGIAVDSLGR